MVALDLAMVLHSEGRGLIDVLAASGLSYFFAFGCHRAVVSGLIHVALPRIQRPTDTLSSKRVAGC